MVNYSCEAMSAVTESPLGKAIEGLMQEVIDYRDSLSIPKGNYNARSNLIQRFFAEKIAKRYIETVNKYTGLTIVQIFFKPHFKTCFCTWILFGKGSLNWRGTEQITGILNGQANKLVEGWYPGEFSVKELMILAKSYDVEKGIIKPEMRKEISKYVKCAMGFDIALGFLLEDYLPPNAGVKYLTAKELTAICLHEIGHNLTLVEHAADLYAHQSKFKALEAAFAKQATTKTAIELAKAVAKEAKSNGYENESSMLLGAVNRLEADSGEVKGVNKAEKNIISATIGSAFFLLTKMFSDATTMVFGNPTNEFNRLGQKMKLGDTVINERMWNWQERKADEYAFTHGYGAYQVSSLEKIGKLYGMRGMSSSDIEHLKLVESGKESMSLFLKLRLSFFADMIFQDPRFRSYPPGPERYREILKCTIRELKAHGADGDYVTKYMEDIESILKSLAEMRKTDIYMHESYLNHQLFYKYCTIRSFITWLVDGRVDTELAEVLNDIQELNNNLVTYYGFKFEQLSKKVK